MINKKKILKTEIHLIISMSEKLIGKLSLIILEEFFDNLGK